MPGQIEALQKTASSNPKRIVLPEGDDPRVLEAASIVLRGGLAKLIIIGKESEVKKKAAERSLSLEKAEIIDPEKFDRQEEMINIFYEARKAKGVTLKDAESAVMGNRVYFGALMIKMGLADGFVAGASHTTSNVARAALYCIGTQKDVKVMSSAFLVEVENLPYGDNGLFVFSDCGVVPDPDAGQLADIAISASRLYESLFKRKARVALLSYSTKGSARGGSIDKVLHALEGIRKRTPGLLVDGELQLDAAIVPEVAKIKAPGSRLAGSANVLIFPNLDSGNISYKLAQRLGRARVVGPLMQGINNPCSDLSRGCLVEEVVDAIVVTAVRAQ